MAAGIGLDTGIAAALVLVALTALAEQLDLVVGRRMRISVSGPFLVAAALVGGPLVGACAGAADRGIHAGRPAQARPLRRRRCRAGARGRPGGRAALAGRSVRRRGGSRRRPGDGLRAESEARAARTRPRLAPRAPRGLARDRRQLVPAGAAARRLPLSLRDGAGPRARIRRRPAARRRLGEPAPPPPRACPRGGTLARAGRRADRRAESLRARGGAHLRAGTDQARRTDGSALLPRPRPLQDGERHVRLRGRRPAARRRPPPAAQRAAGERPRLPLGWGGVRGARPARRRAPSSPTSPSVSACSSRPGRSRSTGARARSPAPSEPCCSTTSRPAQDALEAASRLVKKAKQTRNAAVVETTSSYRRARSAEGGRRSAGATLLLGTRPASGA